MDTQNARLARVLRILADLAERGVHEAHAWQAAERASYAFLFTVDRPKHIEGAEHLATEAARLAGVPLDGWVPVDYTRKGGLPEEYEPVIVTARAKDGELYTGPAVLMEAPSPASGDDGYYVGFFESQDGDQIDNVIAWSRDWPEPYRPEEVPHA